MIKNTWHPLSILDKHYKGNILFACYDKSKDVFLGSYVGTVGEAKRYREWELSATYNCFMYLETPEHTLIKYIL